jgi:predicted dehydrogenase
MSTLNHKYQRHAILKVLLIQILCFISISDFHMAFAQTDKTAPLKVAIAGISHGHASWIYGNKLTNEIQIDGIYEPDTALAAVYRNRFNLDNKLFYTDLKRMLDDLKPEAVMAFGSTYDHLSVVELCAPRGIHVMVEKPLAVSLAHAKRMEQLAVKHNIHLLTNYETSWYPTTHKSYELVNDSNFLGQIKKMIVHDGHDGLRNTEGNKFFFKWLTDPVLNGGGALTDFGCYGANLATYLLKGEEPVSVTAVTRQFKPEIYPHVDDEATIIVSYPSAQCIIQASWNWPFSRKDMEIYGQKGYIIAVNNSLMRLRNETAPTEQVRNISVKETGVYENPFEYFAAVVRGIISLADHEPYALKNNILVVRILDAARQSARTGKTVQIKDKPDIGTLKKAYEGE